MRSAVATGGLIIHTPIEGCAKYMCEMPFELRPSPTETSDVTSGPSVPRRDAEIDVRGGSAQREFERRDATRERHIASADGVEGERRLARHLTGSLVAPGRQAEVAPGRRDVSRFLRVR